MDDQILLQQNHTLLPSSLLQSVSQSVSSAILTAKQRLQPSSSTDPVQSLKSALKNAESFAEWKEAAEKLDTLLGYEPWKQDSTSEIYDHVLVRMRTEELKACRASGDTERLLFMVRTTFERNLGNMGDPKLYCVSHTGTKRLIEEYISECELALQTLLECGEKQIVSNTRILDTLVQTRRAFGRTALVLSGGSVLGILHTGVMHELLHQNLLPRIISGSSAGSIFASILCVHFDYEIDELFDTLTKEKFDIFEETGKEESFFVRLARFLKHGTILDNKYLAQTLQTLLGDLTFQEAYNRTRKIVNVTVSPASIYESARLLNYLTAPNVLIWSAVCASCSVPFIFLSYTLLAKDANTGEHYPWSPSPLKYIDGSVDNDLPLTRLSELFNVDHFIACQVNPHVVPFMKPISVLSGISQPLQLTRLWHEAQNIVNEEFSHYLLVASELGILKNISSKMRSLLTQQYTGDITIIPNVKVSEMKDLFKNPTEETFLDAHLRGARATWPQLSLIRNHCAIELALDKSIHKLRGRLIPTQKLASTRTSGRAKAFFSTANINSLSAGQLNPTSPRLQSNTVNRHNSASFTQSSSMASASNRKSQVQLYNNNNSSNSNTVKAVNLVSHKSEGLHVFPSIQTSMPLPLKRKSSQDLATMFHIGSNLSPTHRTSWSPSVSRKNSLKNVKPVLSTKPSVVQTPAAVIATATGVLGHGEGSVFMFSKHTPQESPLSSVSVSPVASRRTSVSEKYEYDYE